MMPQPQSRLNVRRNGNIVRHDAASPQRGRRSSHSHHDDSTCPVAFAALLDKVIQVCDDDECEANQCLFCHEEGKRGETVKKVNMPPQEQNMSRGADILLSTLLDTDRETREKKDVEFIEKNLMENLSNLVLSYREARGYEFRYALFWLVQKLVIKKNYPQSALEKFNKWVQTYFENVPPIVDWDAHVKMRLKRFEINKAQRNKLKKKKSEQCQCQCAICGEKINFGTNKTHDTPLVQLPCKHIYHKDCLHQWWAKGNLTCPCCRHDISGDKV